MEQKHKILIIVPAYNEEMNIAKTIASLRSNASFSDILVIDDGSTDSTAMLAREGEARVISLPHNMGLGEAMKIGYRYAFNNNYDIAVKLDGDNQHPTYKIKDIVGPILAGRADYVIGSRFLARFNYRPTFPRKVGIFVYSTLFKFVTHLHITDPTCGFCAIGRKGMDVFINNYPTDYPEYEALLISHQANLRIMEVPIKVRRRKDSASSISFSVAFSYTMRVLLKSFEALIKQKAKKTPSCSMAKNKETICHLYYRCF